MSHICVTELSKWTAVSHICSKRVKEILKLSIHLANEQQTRICRYHSVNIYEANANRTFDLRLARFSHEVVHQRQFVRDVDVHVLFIAVCYQNYHIPPYCNLSRESFFQVLIWIILAIFLIFFIYRTSVTKISIYI